MTAGAWRHQTLSLVVPVFNSAGTLPSLVARVARVFTASAHPVELVLVNDGSSDPSWCAIRELVATFPWVRGINLRRNCGQQAALMCGIRHARGSRIVTLDDDLQFPPEEIPRLLDALETGADLVYGTPAMCRHRSWRQLGSWLVRGLLHRSTAGASRDFSPFRAFRAHLRDGFPDCDGSFLAVDLLLQRVASTRATVQVAHHPSQRGDSRYGPWRLASLALGLIGAAQRRPARAGSSARVPACMVADTVGGAPGDTPHGCP